MRPFHYCPACSRELHSPDHEGARGCPDCSRIWYQNPAPTTGAAIVQDGKALVTKRARPPEEGRYDIPGGFVNVDEHPITALEREVREELGVEIEIGLHDLLTAAPHMYGDDGQWVLALGFKARIMSGEPKPNDDVADIIWVSRDELDEIDFAWAHDRELLRKVLADG